jgi:hypothetical protein
LTITGRLRLRAAEHGHIRARVEPLGGIDLDLRLREPTRNPPRFD